ncbi:hypothetical protein LG296_06790 [Ureibacillus chungkukjangi]|uniref:hypothetical protein n=1 Tax=Ureibacillus chungkukjangi TaxID=1202712 RepID=UPI003851693D
MDKKVEIINKYDREIMDIKHKLDQLENARIYELTDVKMDGALATNIQQLRNMLSELIYKIEYDVEPLNEKLNKAFNQFHNK